MEVAIEFGSYNPRRYGKPWIAKVTAWPVGGNAELDWGSYCGDDDGGEAIVDAAPGDIVRWGQRDHRGGNTTAHWGIVREDGSVDECTAPDARHHWREAHKAEGGAQ